MRGKREREREREREIERERKRVEERGRDGGTEDPGLLFPEQIREDSLGGKAWGLFFSRLAQWREKGRGGL